jgi:hypothetical protein
VTVNGSNKRDESENIYHKILHEITLIINYPYNAKLSFQLTLEQPHHRGHELFVRKFYMTER